MAHRLIPLILPVLLGAAAPATGHDVFEGSAALPDAVLAAQRGGFNLAGLDIRMGAQLTTRLNGELALMTTINWTDSGATTTRYVSPALTPVQVAGMIHTGAITMRVGTDTVYLANDGRTALTHRTDSGLQSVIVNTANNAVIQTDVTAALDIGNYPAFRESMDQARISATIGSLVSGATAGIMGN